MARPEMDSGQQSLDIKLLPAQRKHPGSRRCPEGLQAGRCNSLKMPQDVTKVSTNGHTIRYLDEL